MSSSTPFEPRDIARIAVFAAIIIALGAVIIPLPGGIPITGQTLGVMLAGAILGARRGTLAVTVVLVLAAIGLPVLAGGRGGLIVFVSPTSGYLIGWLAGAFITGLIAHSGAKISWLRTLAGAVIGGVLAVYAFGIPVQTIMMNLPPDAALLAAVPFLPGDLIKAVATAVLVSALYRAYPRAFPFSSKAVEQEKHVASA
ncbi:biotin transporter BioY [Microbacterium sp. YY-01]|uniref:biotin transporter BioY n=1 Tax=Microbacterium sp. YY-01 TaxID=3421634 RepID=UPI003D187603